MNTWKKRPEYWREVDYTKSKMILKISKPEKICEKIKKELVNHYDAKRVKSKRPRRINWIEEKEKTTGCRVPEIRKKNLGE